MIGLRIVGAGFAMCLVGCGSDLADAAPGSGDPFADPGGRVVVPGSGGSGGAGGAGGEGGSVGACDNTADLAVLLTDNPAPVATTSCFGLSCRPQSGDVSLYSACVSTCIANATPGLSMGCADCYGELAACGLGGVCLESCVVDTCSVPCLNCLNFFGCFTAFAECRGINAPFCP